MRSDETIPRFLWRLAWGGLFAAIAVGLIALILLAAGTGDPPKAGPLIYQSTTETNIPLPPSPYTLEVTGRFAVGSDPADVWGVELLPPLSPAFPPVKRGTVKDGFLSPSPFMGEGFGVGAKKLLILLNGYGFFSVLPFQPDFTPFIHIRTNGESNKITLDVGKSGDTVLRINDEIAWKGLIPPTRFVAVLSAPRFTLEQVAIYALK